ncbi:MAG: hypothetical protein U1F43_03215 [Myxococcota bacterium]
MTRRKPQRAHVPGPDATPDVAGGARAASDAGPARSEDKSTHILNASSTLLGLCFVVLTSLRVLELRGRTIIDEVTSLAMILFMTSSILSFLSIRSRTRRGARYERIADNVFLAGLVLLFVTTMLVSFNVVD